MNFFWLIFFWGFFSPAFLFRGQLRELRRKKKNYDNAETRFAINKEETERSAGEYVSLEFIRTYRGAPENKIEVRVCWEASPAWTCVSSQPEN